MPNYNLKCPKCNHTWSEFISISEREKATCPKCNTKAENNWGASGSRVAIKGSGFYQESTVR